MILLVFLLLLLLFGIYGGLALSPLLWVLVLAVVIAAVLGRGRYY